MEKKLTIVAILPESGHQDTKGLGLHVKVKSSSAEGTMKESKLYDDALREMRKKRPNSARAMKLLELALRRRDARAAYALATWYLHGTHVKKDTRQATALLRQAAEANIPDALYDLAVSYEKGIGVKKSEKKAYELYLRAAVWGEKQSFYEVGRCLFYGIGAARSRRLASVWLDRAKSLGIA